MMNIGSKIKKLRLEQKLSLTALSQKSGVQIATLSRIEHGQMTGTLESHLQIAKALGVEILSLYENLQTTDEPITPSHQVEHTVIQTNAKVTYEILAKQPSTKKMLPRLLRIEPKSSTTQTTLPAGCESFIFMLEGSILIQLKEQKIALLNESSFYFNSAQPHFFINESDVPAKLLMITTPVIL